MALSPPAERKLRHKRSIEICGHERDDGLWDMQGVISDHKPTPYGKLTELREDGMIHRMHVRLTVDSDLMIHKAEAWSEITPYGLICAETNPDFAALAGLRIGPGFVRKARVRVGGVAGCTHIVELLPQMATATIQTIWPIREETGMADNNGAPGLLNTCHALAESSPVVQKRFPEFYRPAGQTRADGDDANAQGKDS